MSEGEKNKNNGGLTRRSFLKYSGMGLGALTFASSAYLSGYSANENHLALWQSQAPNTFLGYYSLGDYARYHNDLIFQRPFYIDPQGNFVPHLAEKLTISDDKKTYTYKLFDNAKWHDGVPVTANDLKFTIETLAHPKYDGSDASDILPIKGAKDYNEGKADSISGVKVLNNKTISLTLDEVFAPFREICDIWTLPEHLLGDIPVEELGKSEFSRKPVGCGPFKFEEYKRGQYYELVRNDDYHLGKPELERITVQILDPEVAVAHLETGQVDASFNYKVAQLPPASIERLQNKPNVQINIFDTDQFQFIILNHKKTIMKDQKFRQALSYAIDRDSIVKSVLRGYGSPAKSPLRPGNPYHNPNAKSYPHDPQKARELLKEVDWENNKRKLIYATPKDEKRRTIAAIVQQNLKNVGVDTAVQVYDFATLMDKGNEGELDLWNLGWGSGGVQHPHYTMYQTLHSSEWPPRWNFGWYKNEQVDKLLDEGVRTVDREKSIEIYHKAQEVIAEDLPYLYLVNEKGLSGQRARVKNFNDNIHSANYNAHEWDVE